jgi:amino acid adenylation domain-containing protein
MTAQPRTTSEVLRNAAARFADRPALRGGSTALTYAELDDCTDALARRLAAAGAEPGHRVGLCVAGGPLALLASAALMRAGCAYVPLDPSQPEARLTHIVSDGGVTLAVADDQGRSALAGTPLSLLTVSGDDLIPGRQRGAGPELPGPDPESDAYVMYTSGSTGLPKGVAITQASLMFLLQDAVPLFGFGPDESWPLQHGYGFDVSVWEMWAGITVGATLTVVADGTRRDPERLAELLLRSRPTRLHIVPSVFAQLAEVVAEQRLRVPLRGVAFCGEALNYVPLRTWTGAHPGAPDPVWNNCYGITETTVYNTFTAVSPGPRDGAATPIGRGYRHSPVVVLDESLRPARPGEVGEFFIGGGQVANGYLSRPELTAERFLELPGRAGRWYRTGDFGYPDEAGELHFIGRRDSQVKIRGHRVELGEIEHAARELAWVADAAVTQVPAGPGGEPVLALFVVAATELPDPRERARRDLAAVLPAHMLPGRVLAVPRLPQNANGKCDRAALGALLGS